MKRTITLVVAALSLLIIPISANAACGSFGAAGLKNAIKLPIGTHADMDFHVPIEGRNPAIVGLWHVIYTNDADQSTFNDTLDTWHLDGTEIESAFLARPVATCA